MFRKIPGNVPKDSGGMFRKIPGNAFNFNLIKNILDLIKATFYLKKANV